MLIQRRPEGPLALPRPTPRALGGSFTVASLVGAAPAHAPGPAPWGHCPCAVQTLAGSRPSFSSPCRRLIRGDSLSRHGDAAGRLVPLRAALPMFRPPVLVTCTPRSAGSTPTWCLAVSVGRSLDTAGQALRSGPRRWHGSRPRAHLCARRQNTLSRAHPRCWQVVFSAVVGLRSVYPCWLSTRGPSQLLGPPRSPPGHSPNCCTPACSEVTTAQPAVPRGNKHRGDPCAHRDLTQSGGPPGTCAERWRRSGRPHAVGELASPHWPRPDSAEPRPG